MAHNDEKLKLADIRDHMLVNPHTKKSSDYVEGYMAASGVTGEIFIRLHTDDGISGATIHTLIDDVHSAQFLDKEHTLSMIKNNAAELKLADGTKHLTLASSKNDDGITEYTLGESDIASESGLNQEISDRKAADTTLQGNIDKVAESVNTISKSVYDSPDGLFPRVGVLEGALEYERKLRDEQKENIDKEFKNVVYWDLPKHEDGTKNTITLENGDQILGRFSGGTDGAPLIYMTKWNGIQIGGTKNEYVDINLNPEKHVISGTSRITVNADNYVAYLSDINEAQSALTKAIEAEESARTEADEAIREGVGLEEDGSYKANTGNTYTKNSETIAKAIDDLDNAISGLTIVSGESVDYQTEYKLVDSNSVQHGVSIMIPHDSAMVYAWVGRDTDHFLGGETGTTIEGYKPSGETFNKDVDIVKGEEGNVTLNLIYEVTDGTYTMVHIDFNSLIVDQQFEDGLVVEKLSGDEKPGDDYVVKVKIDTTSDKNSNGESYLTVSKNGGVKLSGINAAIKAAQASATTVVEHATGNTHVTVTASTAADGHKVYTVVESDIASATDLETEKTRATTKEDALQKELDDTQSGAGLNCDGSYVQATGATYINKAETLADADKKLDAALAAEAKTRGEKDTELENDIKAVSGSTGSLQKELDTTQIGAGLEDDGSYSADTTTNYLKNAESLKDADKKLDTEIKSEKDRAEAAEKSISGTVETVIEGAGLSEDGTYTAPTGTSYVSGATSLADADKKLDAALKNVEEKAIFGVASGENTESGEEYDDCNIKYVTIDGHKYLDFTHMIIDCGTF